jgi:hypothetical protein
MPEDVLAETAGLSDGRGRSLVELAMARAEQVLAWSHGPRATVKPAERLTVLLAILREQRQAADALLPYGLAKMSPDVVNNIQATTINMPGSHTGGDGARVIEGRMAGGFAPPPMPGETVENQMLGADDLAQSDNESRTE